GRAVTLEKTEAGRGAPRTARHRHQVPATRTGASPGPTLRAAPEHREADPFGAFDGREVAADQRRAVRGQAARDAAVEREQGIEVVVGANPGGDEPPARLGRHRGEVAQVRGGEAGPERARLDQTRTPV